MRDSPAGGERNPAWARVDALFAAALELPPDRRMAFVRTECDGDALLLEQVEELLHAAEASRDFLEIGLPLVEDIDLEGFRRSLTGDVDPTLDPREDEDRVGERLGPFEIRERLGRGGMATVYRAERVDGEWSQQVAIKVLRRGLDTEDIVRRFRAERQILSSLNHPNIATLLDGGTTLNGLPYLVMEYVAGEPLTHYCDRLRLDVTQRLRLFRNVVDAVQHAHRNLVVHRDIKPSNVLVGEDGAPKLLDFGIARVMGEYVDEDTRTRDGHLLFTPRYASPEQSRGEAVTTSSDVYQLGVLLSLLLVGRSPFAGGVSGRAAEAASGETRLPSALVDATSANTRGWTQERLCRQLRGDLDTIVTKAVQAAPALRYGSAEALSADIERHIDGHPIEARPPSWSYRTSLLLRRRPWVSAAVIALLVQGVIYSVSVSRHARNLEVERERAVLEVERSEQVQRFLVQLFQRSDPYVNVASSEMTVREALDLGVERVRSELDGQPEVQARLLGAIGDVYGNMGVPGVAARLQAESLDLYRSADATRSQRGIQARRKLGQAVLETGRADTALIVLRSGVELAEDVLGPSDTTTLWMHMEMGRAQLSLGRFDDAALSFTDVLDRTGTLDPGRPDLEAGVHYWLSEAHMGLGQPERALGHAERALLLDRSWRASNDAQIGVKTLGLARALAGVGRVERSVVVTREGIRVLDEAMGADHPDSRRARNSLALRLQSIGRWGDAERIHRGLLRSSTGDDPTESARGLQNLAVNLEGQGRLAEADSLLGEAYRAFAASMPEGHYMTVFPLITRSGIQLQRGDMAGAERSAAEATRTLESALPEGHYAVAVARCRWGRSLVGLGRNRDGRALLDEAANALESSSVVQPDHALECLEAWLATETNRPDSIGRISRIRERIDELEAEIARRGRAEIP